MSAPASYLPIAISTSLGVSALGHST